MIIALKPKSIQDNQVDILEMKNIITEINR